MKQYKKIEISEVYNLDNLYIKKYLNLISYRQKYKLDPNIYQEKHHIIPRYFYKVNKLKIDGSSKNIVNLTAKEHILAHLYLYKYYSLENNKFANYNLLGIFHLCNKQLTIFNDILTKEDKSFFLNTIDKNKQAYLKIRSEISSKLIHSDETKKKIAISERLEKHYTCQKIYVINPKTNEAMFILKNEEIPNGFIISTNVPKHKRIFGRKNKRNVHFISKEKENELKKIYEYWKTHTIEETIKYFNFTECSGISKYPELHLRRLFKDLFKDFQNISKIRYENNIDRYTVNSIISFENKSYTIKDFAKCVNLDPYYIRDKLNGGAILTNIIKIGRTKRHKIKDGNNEILVTEFSKKYNIPITSLNRYLRQGKSSEEILKYRGIINDI